MDTDNTDASRTDVHGKTIKHLLFSVKSVYKKEDDKNLETLIALVCGAT